MSFARAALKSGAFDVWARTSDRLIVMIFEGRATRVVRSKTARREGAWLWTATLSLTLLVGLTGCQTPEMTARLAEDEQRAVEEKNNIVSLSEVIKRNPSDANALNLRGAAFGQAGEYERALSDFNAAISINGQYFQAYNNRALIYTKVKRFDRALADYNQSISIAPQYSQAYVGRGNIYKAQKNYQSALTDFSRAVEIQPNDAIAHFNRGLMNQALGKNQEAVEDFGMTMSLKGDVPGVHMARGVSELAMQEYKKAFEDFNSEVQTNKDNYEAWAYRGRAAESQGDRAEASRSYKHALQINPSFKPASDGLERVGSEGA
jgi:tetratricopeptide (TPR) repeat protein